MHLSSEHLCVFLVFKTVVVETGKELRSLQYTDSEYLSLCISLVQA